MNFRKLFSSNNWWGKLFGAFFGYLIAGPAGALFGILIGNLFDKGLGAHFSRPHFSYHDERREAVQQVFFEAVFTIMGHLAKADGQVTKNDIKMARQIMYEMRLTHQQQATAQIYFNEGKKNTFNFHRMINRLHTTCYDNHRLLKSFIDIQYRAAQVDGLTLKKLQLLELLFKQLGFAPLHQQYRFYEDFGHRQSSSSSQGERQQRSTYQNARRPAQDNLSAAYVLLQVSPTANKQEVKRAYRRAISKNHPDKLMAKGLSEKEIKMANEKTHQITKAYELICANKGW